MNNDDYVCFRIGSLLSNDLRDLYNAIGTEVTALWYTRLQMRFMVAAGHPNLKPFAEGPALEIPLEDQTDLHP